MPLGNLLHSMVEVLIIHVSVNKKKLQLYEILRSFATLIEIFCFLLSTSVQSVMSKYS